VNVRDLPQLDGARHRFVKVSGTRIHVAELGDPDAPALMFLHGWPQHWWMWRRVAPSLAGEFRCVMPDLRGHGWSDVPEGGYEKEQLSADARGLMDVLELDRVGLVGHDWGGWTSMLTAAREPDRVSALLALSIAHPWPSRHDRFSVRRAASLSYQLPLSTPVVGPRLMSAGATRRILERAAPAGTYSEDELAAFDDRMRRPEGGRATAAIYRSFLLKDLPRVVAGRYRELIISQPAHLVVGSRDLVFIGSDLRGFENNAPNMTLYPIEGVGHFLPEERPDIVVDHARELFGQGANPP
jgi:pimeloyl-ACP methyl ester carboxylesterase